jgi:hypothetical protein
MDGEQRMRVDGIAAGEVVKASVGGRIIYGEVLEIREAVVYFNPVALLARVGLPARQRISDSRSLAQSRAAPLWRRGRRGCWSADS